MAQSFQACQQGILRHLDSRAEAGEEEGPSLRAEAWRNHALNNASLNSINSSSQKNIVQKQTKIFEVRPPFAQFMGGLVNLQSGGGGGGAAGAWRRSPRQGPRAP